MFSTLVALIVVTHAVSADNFTLCQDVESHKNLNLLSPETECGPLFADFKMINRGPARPGDFPWMALLLKHPSDSRKQIQVCDGSIINQKYIVTSAQCLNDISNTTELSVLLGTVHFHVTEYMYDHYNSSYTPVVNLTVEEIIPHERYDNKSFINDIALVRLYEEIEYTEYIQPLCLPRTCAELTRTFNDTDYVLLMGWGTESEGEEKDPVITRSRAHECDTLWKRTYRWPNEFATSPMCKRRAEGRSNCVADSPMALVYQGMITADWEPYPNLSRNYLMGMANLGFLCDHGNPGHIHDEFPRISHYVPWILDHIRA